MCCFKYTFDCIQNNLQQIDPRLIPLHALNTVNQDIIKILDEMLSNHSWLVMLSFNISKQPQSYDDLEKKYDDLEKKYEGLKQTLEKLQQETPLVESKLNEQQEKIKSQHQHWINEMKTCHEEKMKGFEK